MNQLEAQISTTQESEYEAPMFIVIGELSIARGPGGNEEDSCTGGHWENNDNK